MLTIDDVTDLAKLMKNLENTIRETRQNIEAIALKMLAEKVVNK